LVAAFGAAFGALAQPPLFIYADRIVNGFQDWSWGTRSFTNPSPAHKGRNSISVSPASSPHISFHQTDFNTSAHTNLKFWANGGIGGGQVLKVAPFI
jgi:hypothetical protein